MSRPFRGLLDPQMTFLRPDLVLMEQSYPGAEAARMSTDTYALIKDTSYFIICLRRNSKLITRHISLIETLNNIFIENDQSKLDKDIINYIEKEHKILVEKFGAKILKIHIISRENVGAPYPSQNADFSINTIKKLITQGKSKAVDSLK